MMTKPSRYSSSSAHAQVLTLCLSTEFLRRYLARQKAASRQSQGSEESQKGRATAPQPQQASLGNSSLLSTAWQHHNLLLLWFGEENIR